MPREALGEIDVRSQIHECITNEILTILNNVNDYRMQFMKLIKKYFNLIDIIC